MRFNGQILKILIVMNHVRNSFEFHIFITSKSQMFSIDYSHLVQLITAF